ncbi:MAG: hypothetical protein ACKO23_02630 [Gemmataceae bacterium]
MSTSRINTVLLNGLILGILLAIPLLRTLVPTENLLTDPDIWWHLRVGQWIVDNGRLPLNDPFSLPGQSVRWIAYSWLFEVVLYEGYRHLGLWAILLCRILGSMAVILGYFALAWHLTRRFMPSIVLTALVVLVITPVLNERPWLITILGSQATLAVLLRFQEPGSLPRWVWLLPLVFVLWANTHIQFVYGLILLAIGLVAPLADRLLPTAFQGTALVAWEPRWWKLAGLAAGCIAATLATPFHWHLYEVVVEYATQPGPFRWVDELMAPNFRDPADWVLLALTCLACVCLRGHSRGSFAWILLACAVILGFRARRDGWIVGLTALFVIGTYLRDRLSSSEEPWPGVFLWIGTSLAVLGSLALASSLRDLREPALEKVVAHHFPAKAVQHIQEQRYPGPLFNPFDWGGYLIWALPEYPVTLDGRTNLHGDSRIERHLSVWAGQRSWKTDPDLSGAGLILVPVSTPLYSLLKADTAYRKTHEDELAAVFVPTRAK